LGAVGAAIGVLPGIALFVLPWDSPINRAMKVLDWIPEKITDLIQSHTIGGPPEARFFVLLPTVFAFWLAVGIICGTIVRRVAAKRGTDKG
ncbi:MAG TPA: hypothetical protein VK178_02190, partial [Opitutaceae bacterium]|nr:hypothetical protein [Opitutaceae bacterium]